MALLAAYQVRDKINSQRSLKIEYTFNKYIPGRRTIDIIAGTFFIAYAPIDSENFQSLPKELEEKYCEKFKLPERFAKANDEIIAIPFRPARTEKER